MKTPTTKDFTAKLNTIFSEAEKEGLSEITVNALELHKEVGGYPSPSGNHRMHACCNAMHEAKKDDDDLIKGPPSGKSSTLTIKYKLPRG